MQSKSVYMPALLQAHQFQGQSYDCGPYSTAIIINALIGTNLRGETVARQLNAPARRGIFPIFRRIPGWATFPWGIVGFLQEHGLKADWKVLASHRHLLECLEKPVIPLVITGEWRPLWAHYLIFVEYGVNSGYGFVDPAHTDAAIVYKDEKTFLRQWSRVGRNLIEVTVP